MEAIHLASGHLIISAAIANEFFGEASHVNLVYYAQRKTMLLAPVNDDLFKSLHKTSMVMLKLKNSRGDKSVTIQEVLIDNDIDATDRLLNFQADNIMKIISLFF